MRLLMCVLLLGGCVIHRSLGRDEILSRLQRDFPVERRKSLFYVRLQDPDVTFPGGDRLGLRLGVEAGALLARRNGHAAVEGRVDFREGAIYLADAQVRELDLGVELPPEWGPQVKLAAETAILALLVERPIYRIDDGRVKKVWVQDQRLMLEIRP